MAPFIKILVLLILVGLTLQQEYPSLGLQRKTFLDLGIGSIYASGSYVLGGTNYYLMGSSVVVRTAGAPDNIGSKLQLFNLSANSDRTIIKIIPKIETNLVREIFSFTISDTDEISPLRTIFRGGGAHIFRDCAYHSIHDRIWVAAGSGVTIVAGVSGTITYSDSQIPIAGRPSGLTALLSVVYDPSTNYVIFGGVSGWILTMAGGRTLNANANGYTYKKLGVWNQNFGYYNPLLRNVFFGSDSGLISEINTRTLSMTGIVLLPDVRFTEAAFDILHQTLFVVAQYPSSNNTVFRVRVRDWSIIAQLSHTTPIGGVVTSGFVSGSTAYFPSGNGRIYAVNIYDCSSYDCQTCQMDTEYWYDYSEIKIFILNTISAITYYSYASGFCQPIRACSSAASCPTTNLTTDWNQIDYNCPRLENIVPARGLIDKNTLVTVYSSFLLNGQVINPALTFCDFGAHGTTPVEAITFNTLSCRTPRVTIPSNAFVKVKYRGGFWATNSVPFTFYSCSSNISCNACTGEEYEECGWCLSSQTCSMQTSCGASDWFRQCPVITSIQLDSASILSNKQVTLTVSPHVSDSIGSYFVEFGNGLIMPAQRTSNTQIVVNTPILSRTVFDSLRGSNLEVDVNVKLLAESKEYARKDSSFMFYACDIYETDCAACVDAYAPIRRKQDCVFCFNTPGCIDVRNSSQSCTSNGRCPTIDSVTPAHIHISDVGSTTLTVVGKFSFGNEIRTWQCAWNVLSEADPTIFSSISTVVNSSLISCNIPASLAVGIHRVSIWENSGSLRRITRDYEIDIYGCSDDTCHTCNNVLHPKCFWCQTSLTCLSTPASCTTSINALDNCPVLSISSPSTAATLGGEIIYLNGNFRFSQITVPLTVNCAFVQNGTVRTVLAVNYTDTGVVCQTPTASHSHNESAIQIMVNGEQYTNSIPFEFYDCGEITSGCQSCLLTTRPLCQWCAGAGSCSFSCISKVDICPDVTPDYGYIGGGELVTIRGGPFPLMGEQGEQLIYTCVFGTEGSLGTVSEDGLSLKCITPPTHIIGNVTLSVTIGATPFASTDKFSFQFYDCITLGEQFCSDQCINQPFCGWCASTSTCSSRSRCPSNEKVYLDQCLSVTSENSAVQLGQQPKLVVNVFPSVLDIEYVSTMLFPPSNETLISKRALYQADPTNLFFCKFDNVAPIPAEIANNHTTFTCLAPNIAIETVLDMHLVFENTPLGSPIRIGFTDCASITSCDACLQNEFCGWCSSTASCSVASLCQNDFSRTTCPASTGLVVGLVVSAAALIVGAILLVYFLRLRKRKGLYVALTEPNYTQVAFQADLQLQYKINAHDDFKALEDSLANKAFLSVISAITAPTEQDLVAKSCVYLAHRRNAAAELVQYFAVQEIVESSGENTLFRQNSISSKMFKFYSKIVGIRYLFGTLALVINELNTIADQRSVELDQLNEDGTDDKKVSLLTFEMEVDPSKIKDANVDIDQNVFQLAAACQKIFSAIKNGEDCIPKEFRQIFQRMSQIIVDKYESEEAAMKAVGGLLFLRFITPAITAPHYYGLLKAPPNQVAQRQLVLIAKVLQNLANMSIGVAKEEFMHNFDDFMNRNLPKVKMLYKSLLDQAIPNNQKLQLDTEVPEEVRKNSLAAMYTHIHRNSQKINELLKSSADEEHAAKIKSLMDSLIEQYGDPPKREKRSNDDE